MDDVSILWTNFLKQLTCTVLQHNPHLLAVNQVIVAQSVKHIDNHERIQCIHAGKPVTNVDN
ncbi:MAG: hypothetical protein R3E39_06395 [Anaerolineae bacterium]